MEIGKEKAASEVRNARMLLSKGISAAIEVDSSFIRRLEAMIMRQN
jgi:hypothetical protein